MNIVNKIQKKLSRKLAYMKWKKSIPKSSSISYKTSIISGFANLHVEECVSIGTKALIFCTGSKVTIKRKVVIGPGLTIIAGDHNFTTVGKFIIDEHNKLPENDQDVVINSDTWIGANVTILKGVTIGRGCVIAACSCVTKSVPPYSIVGGVPAKVIKKRFTEEQIREHEKILYYQQ